MVRGLYQVDLEQGVGEAPLQDTHLLVAALHPNLAQGLGLTNLFYGPGVGWDNEPRVVPQLDQGRGQAGRHVGEAAGLDQRVGLAAGHEDPKPARALRWPGAWTGEGTSGKA